MLSRFNIFRQSLLTQLIISFSLLSFMTVGAVATSAYVQAREALKTSVYDRLKVAVALRESELNQWLENQRKEAVLLAQAPIILDSLDSLLGTVGAETSPAMLAEVQDYLNLVLEVKTDIRDIEILNLGGIVTASTNSEDVGIYMGLGNNTTYFEPGQSDVSLNVYFSSITGRPTVRYATPIIEGGERKAVLAITLNLDDVNRIVRETTGLGETGEIYLMKELVNQAVFISGDPREAIPENDNPTSEGIERAIEGQDGQGLYRNYDGTPVVGVYRWLDNNKIALLAELSQEEAFQPATNLARGILLVGLLAIAILLILVRLLARQIARPVLTITDAAAAIENERFDLPMLDPVIDRPDELGQLAQVVRHMADQVYAREARLKAQIQAGGQQATKLELAYYEALRKKSAWLRQKSAEQVTAATHRSR